MRTIEGPNPQITVHSPTVDFYPFSLSQGKYLC